MTTTVTIGAGEKIWDTLSLEDNDALRDWLHRNGLDSAELRSERQLTVANGLIDCWSVNPVIPAGAKVIEISWASNELPDVHLQTPVVEDMEPGLAERVNALWVARVEWQAGIAGKLAAAEAEAKVWREAGF